MIKYIDGFHIAAEVRLLRQLHKGAILIVEGGDDAKVFDRFIDTTLCKTQVAFGKTNVLDALDQLEDEGFRGVLAVVDADFDRLLGVSYPLDNLCVTEAHDMDLMIFGSTALARYLCEHADDGLFQRNFNGDLNAVRKSVLDACRPIACCRLASERANLRLNFKDLRLENYIDDQTLAVDTDALVQLIVRQSTSRLALASVKTLMAKEAEKNHDPDQLVCGHDASAVLGIALRRMLGKRRSFHTWASEIEAGLRLAFDKDEFAKTNLYGFLREWETKSGMYPIF